MHLNSNYHLWKTLQNSGILLWEKDKNFKFTQANNVFINLLNFKNTQSLIGKTDDDIPCAAKELAEVFRSGDQQVILQERSLRFLEIFRVKNDEWKMMIVIKSPRFDSYGNVDGTTGHAVDVTNPFFKIGYILMGLNNKSTSDSINCASYIISQNSVNRDKLTPRQIEVLFFLLRNKTAKEIALFLKLEVRTIEYYINNIKKKFHCKTKSDLCDKASEKGYLNIIPESLINIQCSISLY